MLYISEEQISKIKLDAENSYPNECCGFIFGEISDSGKRAVEIRSQKNTSEKGERYHRFNISAESMLDAEMYARRNKLDIVGIYHSHPDCPAIPSEYDRAHALPVYSYIIVSVVKGKSAELTCHELDKNSGYRYFIGEQTVIDNKGEI